MYFPAINKLYSFLGTAQVIKRNCLPSNFCQTCVNIPYTFFYLSGQASMLSKEGTLPTYSVTVFVLHWWRVRNERRRREEKGEWEERGEKREAKRERERVGREKGRKGIFRGVYYTFALSLHVFLSASVSSSPSFPRLLFFHLAVLLPSSSVSLLLFPFSPPPSLL